MPISGPLRQWTQSLGQKVKRQTRGTQTAFETIKRVKGYRTAFRLHLRLPWHIRPVSDKSQLETMSLLASQIAG